MGWLSKYPMLTLYLKSYMSGGRGLPKPRHTHATTPVSRKHQFSSAKLHVSMFLDDITSCYDVPMTLTGVFAMLLDIPIATLVGEIQFGVSVPQELHAVACPPVWDRFVPVFGRLLLNDCQSIFSCVVQMGFVLPWQYMVFNQWCHVNFNHVFLGKGNPILCMFNYVWNSISHKICTCFFHCSLTYDYFSTFYWAPMMHLPIHFRLTPLKLRQSYGHLSTSDVSQKNMDKNGWYLA